MPPPPVPAAALAASSQSQSSSSLSLPGDKEDRKKKAEELFSKKRLGEGEVRLDEKRLADAMREERDRKRKVRPEDDDDPWGKGKKKKAGDEVTEEELGMLSRCFLLWCLKVDNISQRRIG